MNPEIKAEWVKRLKSRKYKKGTSVLYNADTNKYCCLGVLCEMAVDAGVVKKTIRKKPVGVNECLVGYYEGGGGGELPVKVRKWAGLKNASPTVIYQGEETSLIHINDNTTNTFGQIANIIEKRL